MPESDAREHSACVVAEIRDDIARNGGFIPASRYIALVLYAPALGYYVAGARRFGAAGDFVTGPELSPLYGGALARQIEAVLGVTRDRQIVELGAGSGALAASMLNALALRRASPTRYRILEVSGALREQQRATITALAHDELARVEWLDRLPEAIDGVVVMNEVLDAVRARNRRSPERRLVPPWRRPGATARSRGASVHSTMPACARWPKRAILTEGDYTSEVNPAAEALVMTTARRIESGALLIVDYGFPGHEYYHRATQRGNARRTLPASRACRSVPVARSVRSDRACRFHGDGTRCRTGRDARRGILDAGVVSPGLRHPRPAGRGRRA